jgi:hypothetical protein
MRKTPIFIQF